MLDSVFIGTTGLIGFSKALRVVSNNLANVNTPGFKGSQANFGDYFYQSPGSSTGTDGRNLQSPTQLGSGVNVLSTSIIFRDGNNVSTGNALDARVTGNGFFVLKDSQGELVYTRNGSFQSDNVNLVSNINGFRVQGLDSNGRFGDIELAGLLTNPARTTSNINYTGNLAAEVADTSVITSSTTTLIDPLGGTRNLTLAITKTSSGNFSVAVTEGSTAVGTGTLRFDAGGTIIAPSVLSMTYTPSGTSAVTFTLDFSRVSARNSGIAADTPTMTTTPTARSTFAFDTQNGHPVGQLSGLALDQNGTLRASYTNGQTANGPSLALARFDSEQDLRELGNGLFETLAPQRSHIGRANTNTFGSLTSGVLEGSNVDLAESFSNLIVMQRGYQASSRVISTANELIQELFDTKGRN